MVQLARHTYLPTKYRTLILRMLLLQCNSILCFLLRQESLQTLLSFCLNQVRGEIRQFIC